MSTNNQYDLGSKKLDSIEGEIFEYLKKNPIKPEKLKEKFYRRASQKTINDIIDRSLFFGINNDGDAEITVSSHNATITYDFTYQGADHNASIKIDGKQGSVGTGKTLSGIKLYGPFYRLTAYVIAGEPGRKWTFKPTRIISEGDNRKMSPRKEEGTRNEHIDNPTYK